MIGQETGRPLGRSWNLSTLVTDRFRGGEAMSAISP